ncbi:hypothetical protein DEO72_LG4g3 [Vigna unguiculata]|uniref:Uncharacterized protein n=1 Tax=Vigna unguiculata TaxID=3917 RepID=A0A4D6LL66_VIGUN|nr:hypothetical protein DEO72_LG4g3 [Vigna unguiculata]
MDTSVPVPARIILGWFTIMHFVHNQDLPTDFAAYVRKRRFKRLELQGSTNTCIVQLLAHVVESTLIVREDLGSSPIKKYELVKWFDIDLVITWLWVQVLESLH